MITELSALVERFESNLKYYKSPEYNELSLMSEFLDPFFKLLGWDVNNEAGLYPDYTDVVKCKHLKHTRQQEVLIPDYTFRIGGSRIFFVEAKKPGEDIRMKPRFAFQLRRYAWSARLPVSILTDFEEFAVYDCLIRPDPADVASIARIKYFTYKELEKEFEYLKTYFSREAVLKGSLQKYADDNKTKKGTTPVDVEFLNDMENWRASLARNIALRNSELTIEQLNYAVQMTIDRIIFLRICEDRGIEDYGHLRDLKVSQEGNQTLYQVLYNLFEQSDNVYNSGLFNFRDDILSRNLNIDDRELKNILMKLYYPESPYEFSVITAEILGQVYEKFLGKVIRLTQSHQAKIEEKPEVKKAGGVYYTPSYIVEYIVKNTVGRLFEGKKIDEVKDIKILDPACGSGSFLLGAYQYLLDWYKKQYIAEGQTKSKKIREKIEKGFVLSIAEKKRILLNHIYGVDIDKQAVEVTKLSLLLKVLEEEDKESVYQPELKLDKALPDLVNNIKRGNSLIGSDYFADKTELLGTPEYDRIAPFDWDKQFPEIMASGGFDAVIGNPPYGAEFTSEEKKYIKSIFDNTTKDSAAIFLEKGLKLTNHFLAMIVPKSIAFYNDWQSIRDFLANNCYLYLVTDTGLAFREVNYEALILCFNKKDLSKSNIEISVANPLKRFKDPKEIISEGILPKEILTFANVIVFRGLDNKTYDLISKLRKDSIFIKDIALKVFRSLYISDEEKSQLKEGTTKFINKVPDVDRYFINKVKYIDISESNRWISKANEIMKPRLFFKVLRGKRIISYPDISGEYLTTEKLVNLFIKSDIYPYSYSFLAGIINSKVPSFYLESVLFSKTTETSRVMDFPYMKHIPIPRIDFKSVEQTNIHDAISSLVDTMLDLQKKYHSAQIPSDKENFKNQIDMIDKQIDSLVYKLYELTDEEIRIVEESV